MKPIIAQVRTHGKQLYIGVYRKSGLKEGDLVELVKLSVEREVLENKKGGGSVNGGVV